MSKKLARFFSIIIMITMTASMLCSSVNANSETQTEVNPTKRYYFKDEQGNDIADKWFEYKFTRDQLAKDDGVPYTDGSMKNTAITITAFSENFGDTLIIPDDLTKSTLKYLYIFDYAKLKKVVLNNEIVGVFFSFNSDYMHNPEPVPALNIETLVVGDNFDYRSDVPKSMRIKNDKWAFRVGRYMQYNLESLKNIEVLDSCTKYVSKDGILYTSDMKKLVACPQANPVQEIELDENVKTIAREAFRNNQNIRKITLSNSVKKIKKAAFCACYSLKEVKGGKGLRIIEDSVFANSGLKEMKLYKGLKEIGECAFIGTKIKKVVIPSSVKWIGGRAFKGSKLVDVKINIKKKYSYDIDQIDMATMLDDDVKEWFRRCTKLKKVKLGRGVITLPARTFDGCKSLETVTLPKTVKKIGPESFANCKKLKKYKIKGNPKIVGKAIGYKCDDRWDPAGKIKGVTIHAKRGTHAEKYAKKHGFKFKAI